MAVTQTQSFLRSSGRETMAILNSFNTGCPPDLMKAEK